MSMNEYFGTDRPDLMSGTDADDILHGYGDPSLGPQPLAARIVIEAGTSVFRNVVGVYDIAEDGSISNIRTVFVDTPPGRAPAIMAGSSAAVEAAPGMQMGVFLLPHAAAFTTVGRLSDKTGHLEFRDSKGAVATIHSAGPLSLWHVNAKGQGTEIKTAARTSSIHSAASAANGFALNGTGFDMTDAVAETPDVLRMGLNDGRGNGKGFDHLAIRIEGEGASTRVADDVSGLVLPDPGADHDTIHGGAGRDTIYGGTGDDVLLGEAGNDRLFGGDGNDALSGGDGNDNIFGEAGDDTLVGDVGNDRLNGDIGNDALYGGEGNDVLFGGDGDDLLDGGDGADTLNGGAGNDMLSGGIAGDSMNGAAGNDTLNGDDGDDTLEGGNGHDELFGGSGNDWLDGGSGHDVMDGGTGNDTMIGGPGDDSMYGGDGADSLDGGSDNDWLDGGSGHDELRGGDGNDTMLGGKSNDTLYGGTGDDLAQGGDGADLIWGDTGNDTLLGEAAWDTLQGGEGDDLLYGGGGFDQLYGGRGVDSLHGDEGNDYLEGGHDDDMLSGGTGSDTLVGSEGNDVLTGGQGADCFVWRTQDVDAWTDTITDFEAGYDRIDLSGLDLLAKGWTAASFLDGAMSLTLEGAVELAISDLRIVVNVQSAPSGDLVQDVWGSILFA